MRWTPKHRRHPCVSGWGQRVERSLRLGWSHLSRRPQVYHRKLGPPSRRRGNRCQLYPRRDERAEGERTCGVAAVTILKVTKEQRKNAPLAFLSQHRAEMAEIARAKLRQAKAHHT